MSTHTAQAITQILGHHNKMCSQWVPQPLTREAFTGTFAEYHTGGESFLQRIVASNIQSHQNFVPTEKPAGMQ